MILKALEALADSRLFRRARPPERALDIIIWWEWRRIAYNLILGVTGAVSAIIILLTGLLTEHAGGEAIYAAGSPLFELLAVILYAIIANVCFTGGWILELVSRRIWRTRAEAFGEIALTWGTLCSVLLTLIPAALAVMIGTYRIIANGWKN